MNNRLAILAFLAVLLLAQEAPHAGPLSIEEAAPLSATEADYSETTEEK